jgi:hypothetical protein
MDHLVCIDEKVKELQALLGGRTPMIVRGAARPIVPYDHVQPQDRLFFVRGDGLVAACSVVKDVQQSARLTEGQSRKFLQTNQPKLNLPPEQILYWAGKQYLVLIEVKDVRLIEPFHLHGTAYGNMDEWLPVGKIESVR